MRAIRECVTLSLLPLAWRREIGASLRAGTPPGVLLEQWAGRRRRDGTAPIPLALGRADAAIVRARAQGIEPVAWGDPRYPSLLAAIADPPPLLWIRGDVRAFQQPAVAVIGSRAGTPYALAVAERLGADLAARGVTVVSGLARGVDSAAHRGALSAGTTIAVLGSGADVIYPPEHGPLARDILQTGALLSELVPGTPPHRRFFPMRNRIISGLVRAVVVVEAGEKSGSLITARLALEEGRDVLAVPGNVLAGRNRGGHALLRDGARIVETADDVLEEAGLDGRGEPGTPTAASKPGAGRADPVLDALAAGEPCDLDVLGGRTGLPAAALLSRLLSLELEGVVTRTAGGRFVRI
jgi:DNA processing protein